jgi:hypothetical protein
MMLFFAVGLSYSQDTKTDKPKESAPTKMVAPTRSTVTTKRTAPENPPPASNTIYYMTSARLSIETGNDNKELLSQLQIFLNRRIGNIPPSVTYEIGLYDYMTGNHPKQEFKVNSTVELVMDCSVQLPNWQSQGWRYGCLNLNVIQDAGIELSIFYSPNFPLDAWKIEKVTLTLEFKDLAGNPHPSMGRLVIPFINSSKILRQGEGNNALRLQTDKFLLPKN